ncbi:MAG: single-stranded-DNA-specific exonuclease RecJ [Oscillospiraceae bacterium]|nr:single-stranded-DNA-specific exonuclease RecJ [Oscillospiraceae bacterium]
MKNTKWITGEYDENTVRELMEALGVPSLTAKLLAVRGITSAREAERFTKKNLSDLYDPFLMCDMQKAVERISEAIMSNEKIAVYGDYDADGVTSTYILVHFLRSLGVDCIYHIPDRFGDGYGVSRGALDSLCAQGVKLVITVDTGITAVEEARYAKELGLDLVITDHHKCCEELPEACAVVNPNRSDCGYPFKALAGVGVAFKLVCAMSGSNLEIMNKYLPYVCIGTVADVMPIADENRIIVANGLKLIDERRETGITALLDQAGSKKGEPLTAGAIGFLVGPRMNAAGRMGSAELSLRLLFADEDNAKELASELDGKNKERQQCEGNIMKEALAVIEAHPEYKDASAIVIDGDGWHHGVLGIVASRICNMFGKPTILISVEDGECRGSGRSVEGVSLHSALGRCSDLLEKFGGHDLAAGIVIKRENIAEFRRRMNEEMYADMRDYVPMLDVDFRAAASELTIAQLHALRAMEPYGKDNEAPKLRLDKCKVARIVPIGNNRHTKLQIEHAGVFQCVYFGKRAETLPFSEGDYIDIVFTPEINNFLGENVQLHIKDARPCEADIAEFGAAYECLANAVEGKASEGVEISYEELGKIWRMITRADFPVSAPLLEVKRRLFAASRTITLSKLLVAFQIFSEVGLMGYDCRDYRVDIKIADHNNKVDLNDSRTYKLFKSCGS